MPDPGYPVYSVGTWFAGGECHWMPLKEENGWLPVLEDIPEDVASAAKVMWLNYPNNPTGAIAGPDYFEKVVEFAKSYDLAVMHDACYTDVTFDGYRHPSFLETQGAMDVGMEFHSLSKTYNMTGWRLGMAVGNAEMINALLIVKSNLDSGVPQAIQHMGIEALTRRMTGMTSETPFTSDAATRSWPSWTKSALRLILQRRVSMYGLGCLKDSPVVSSQSSCSRIAI